MIFRQKPRLNIFSDIYKNSDEGIYVLISTPDRLRGGISMSRYGSIDGLGNSEQSALPIVVSCKAPLRYVFPMHSTGSHCQLELPSNVVRN
jgi:hypothetical protein